MLVKFDVVTGRPSQAPITRRGFLQAMHLAFASRVRPLVLGFTAIADDLAWLMRWCAFGGGLRYAGAG